MPKLENPKHEEFALLLARGVKQGEAYKKAGYADNKGAASRLATAPNMQDRVEELRAEIHAKIQTAVAIPNEENWECLADMGLTMEWVALQYQNIYDSAMHIGSLSAANTAIQSIQKLIEIENNGKNADHKEEEERISVKDTLALLKGMKEIMGEAPKQDEELQYIDVTPKG